MTTHNDDGSIIEDELLSLEGGNIWRPESIPGWRGIEARPIWKPMHKQPMYAGTQTYVNGVSEAVFKVRMCLPAGPYVLDGDVRYIVETIKKGIIQ